MERRAAAAAAGPRQRWRQRAGCMDTDEVTSLFRCAGRCARAHQLSADQHNAGAICCSTRTRRQLLLLFSASPVVYLWCALVPFLRFHVACSVVVLICIAISVDLEPEIVFDSTSSGDSENIFFTTALQR